MSDTDRIDSVLSSPILEKTLSLLTEEEKKSHRLLTYAICLAQLPNDTSHFRFIGESGMNGTIFKFSSIFPESAIYYGVTLDPDHKTQAEFEASRRGKKLDIWLHNVENGVPKELDNFCDLWIDIYSACHYADSNRIFDFFYNVLKMEGYLLIVPGNPFGGLEDFVRQNPDQVLFTPLFRYSRKERRLFISSSSDDFMSIIVEQFRSSGYNLQDDASWEEIIKIMNEMCNVLGVDVVTSFDLFFLVIIMN